MSLIRLEKVGRVKYFSIGICAVSPVSSGSREQTELWPLDAGMTSRAVCIACVFNLFSGWSRLGVCVWNIGTETIEHNQEDPAVPHYSTVASMNYLCYPGHKDISSVAWDPSPASHLLAVCSQTSGLLVIYDTLLLSSMPLKREGNGNRIVCWSPNGEWLYCASR